MKRFIGYAGAPGFLKIGNYWSLEDRMEDIYAESIDDAVSMLKQRYEGKCDCEGFIRQYDEPPTGLSLQEKVAWLRGFIAASKDESRTFSFNKAQNG